MYKKYQIIYTIKQYKLSCYVYIFFLITCMKVSYGYIYKYKIQYDLFYEETQMRLPSRRCHRETFLHIKEVKWKIIKHSSGLNLSVFLIMLGVGMIMSLLPHEVLALTESNLDVSYITSAFAVSYIILQIPIETLSDRYGFKIFFTGGYLLCCLAGMIYYFSDSLALIFVGRIVQEAGEALIWALAPALLSIKYPISKGKAMSSYNAVLHPGLMLGPILGIAVLNFWSDNLAFLFYAAVCLTEAAIIYFWVDTACGGKTGFYIFSFLLTIEVIVLASGFRKRPAITISRSLRLNAI